MHLKTHTLRILLLSVCQIYFLVRTEAATYSVTSAADGTTVDGVSLRWAITQANIGAGPHTISFAIPGLGPHTIALTTELPALTGNAVVTINGFSQAGASANGVSVFSATASNPLNAVYKIILSAVGTAAVSFKGLIISGNNKVVRGIVFKSFRGTFAGTADNHCIRITGNTNSILGCYMGVAEDGITQGGIYSIVGVYIDGTAASNGQNNLIGDGTVSGVNLISGFEINSSICITGANATGNRIRGNMIGLQKDGINIVAGSSQTHGVVISGSANSNVIGSSTIGEGNVISGVNYGIGLGSGGFNSVFGNFIGPAADGVSGVISSPQLRGIYFDNSPGNTIGGTTAATRNVISANSQYGLWFQNASSTGNNVKGNYIGLNKNGNAIMASGPQNIGVGFATGGGASGANTIGGSAVNEGNIISGNSGLGIWLSQAGMTVYGNIIGPQADGVTVVTDNPQGVGIQIDANNQTVGGSASSFMRNIISGNLSYGIMMGSSTATGIVIQGNYIGPGSGLVPITGSSQWAGIYIWNLGANNTIGGTNAGEANVIAYNSCHGVYVLQAGANGNKITGNPIYSNNTLCKPIELNYAGSPGNNGKAVPVINLLNLSSVGGTTTGGFDVIEVFKNTTGVVTDATTYVGSTTANAFGNWTLAAVFSTSDYVMANATSTSNNTSEFTAPISTLPVELQYFSAVCTEEKKVVCNWSTASESNNDFFTVERSEDGAGDWVALGNVKGAGNSNTGRYYEFVDEEPLAVNAYYRLKQTDYNGAGEYFSAASVACDKAGSDLIIFPNPANSGNINMYLNGEVGKETLVVLYDVNGRETFLKSIVKANENATIYTLETKDKLTPGVYMIRATSEDRVLSKKIVVK